MVDDLIWFVWIIRKLCLCGGMGWDGMGKEEILGWFGRLAVL